MTRFGEARRASSTGSRQRSGGSWRTAAPVRVLRLMPLRAAQSVARQLQARHIGTFSVL